MEEKPPENEEIKDIKPSSSGSVQFPQRNLFPRNKIRRSQKYHEVKRERQKAKRKSRKERKEQGGPRQVPHTIESLRVKDETTVGDVTKEALVHHDLENDEFQEYFQQIYAPKVLITYADNPTKKTRIFGKELTRIIPNSITLQRNRSAVKKMVKSAIQNDFTDILIVNENRRQPNGLLLIHLPDGPTAHFKVSNVRITTELKKSHKSIGVERPEVILNNFTTRMGLTVGRMLGSLFHYNPEFVGRRAVAFHNQRDYIFFRHYKYTFNSEGQKASLRELGPRFTLRLRSLQKGTFDSKYGEYEWIIEGRRHALEDNRRKFYL